MAAARSLLLGVMLSTAAAVPARAASVPVAESHIIGEVTDVDRFFRKHVTVRDVSGSEVTVRVPIEVFDLDLIKAGAKAELYYAKGVVLAYGRPGKPPPEVDAVRLVPAGRPPVPGTPRLRTVEGTVQTLDRARGELTLRERDGDLVTLQTPAGAAFPENLTSGQEVVLRATEALALHMDAW